MAPLGGAASECERPTSADSGVSILETGGATSAVICRALAAPQAPPRADADVPPPQLVVSAPVAAGHAVLPDAAHVGIPGDLRLLYPGACCHAGGAPPVLGIAVISLLSATLPAATFGVSDFGARGDGRTDDGPAIRAALNAAAEAGEPSRIVFERRTYRLEPWDGSWFALYLADARDVVLDGHGAAFLVHPATRVLFLDRCERVTVRNFRIDYDPLPYTQGSVLEVASDRAWFTLHLDDGYPDLPAQTWVEANGGAGDWRHGVFADPTGRFTHAWVPVGRVERVAGAARTYRVTPPASARDSLAKVAVGHRFAMRVPCITADRKRKLFAQGSGQNDLGVFQFGGPLANIRLAHTRDCVLEGIDQLMAPDMGVHLFDTWNTRLQRIRSLRKPGTNRLMAGMSDGVHCKGNLSGPIFDECHFEALGDDSINISHHPEVVVEQRSPRELLTQYSDIMWFDSPLQPGDELEAFDPVEGTVVGRASAENVQFVQNQQRLVTLDRDLPGLREAGSGSFDDAVQLYRVPRERFAIRSCRFRSQLKTAMLVRTTGLVEGNDVRDCAYGVTAYNCERFREGPYPRDLAIRGNRFERIWIGAINILTLAPKLRAPLGDGIVIERNRIRQHDGSGIDLTQLADVVLRDNRVEIDAATPSHWLPVHLTHCGRVTIDGLRIDDLRPGTPAAVTLDRMGLASLAVEGLRARMAPGVPGVAAR